MSTELLYIEESKTLGFGDYTLPSKTKVEDFEFQGDLYKVKTFAEITKLERNGMFVYESVPGTSVREFQMTDVGVAFKVSGVKDTQITVELEPKTEYKVCINGKDIGIMMTNLSGKLSMNAELMVGVECAVAIESLLDK